MLSLAARVPKPAPGPMKAGERLSAVLELCFVYHAKGFPAFFLHKQTVHLVCNKASRRAVRLLRRQDGMSSS
jgi:predicted RNA polymerase sigma factor